ncbi:hypothetical protein P171DRAFT_519846 [Karstenula rhodostoma CBS 690.94]|uniref:KANL3/Tex30 alpha/beta hydrolase-like domain-containing protein n=1 Tax=Karstenula rhodostoma CBS 690.94 TaxID=1392251 RepID=A0A9P4UEC1_9PLEO|nr:hypothetical protein P171DRAFT_519846 [Karstenula rhodostoma CBS 690.94]
MADSKRKADDTNDAPEPKRRVTRSVSKAPAPVPAKQAPKPKSKAPAAKASKPSKRAAKAAPPNVEKTSNKTEESAVDSPPANDTPRAVLTIQHAAVKKPITCHRYPDSPEPNLPTPGLLFTHGAGGTLSTPAVVNFCTGYSTVHPMLAFQGSMNLAARIKGFHACISHLGLEKQRLTLGGRSMGARAAVVAGTEVLADDALRELWLVLVSYPLKGPKDVRDQILLHLPAAARVLFVIGDKDAMCPLDLLEETRGKMAAKSRLVVVRGADHGMRVRPVAEERRLGEEAGRLAAMWAGGEADDGDVYIGGEEEG